MDRLFTYRIPSGLKDALLRGSIVRVPFGKRMLAGFVIDINDCNQSGLEEDQIKSIDAVLQRVSPWSSELIALAQWMQHYYGCALLEALRVSLPPLLKISSLHVKPGIRYERCARLSDNPPEELKRKLTAGQLLIIEHLKEAQGFAPLPVLRARQGFAPGSLDSLVRKGLVTLEQRVQRRIPSPARAFTSTEPLLLNEGQQGALKQIESLLASDKGTVMLLHGVTGSGKTEIYMQALDRCLSMGKKGIVLIPEISLTPQALDRFRGRFGAQVALLHSGLSAGERTDEWRRIQQGEASIVLGARSAIFAPVENLGLIVIDEEHESSYKQDVPPRYQARHIAVKRAIYHGCPVILGSGTPSVESFLWAREGRYTYCHLPDRVEGRKPPTVRIVDMRRSFNRAGEDFLSPYLLKKMDQTLEKKRQVVLLHNRRGLFNYLLCKECGHIMKCPRCDIALRVHGEPRKLVCHYCLHEAPVPPLCPHCQGFSLEAMGVGTQKLEQQISRIFPEAVIVRMDRDTTSKKGSHEALYDRFASGKGDILLGTQMIAKGFDFPRVTLVGVILADVALSLPDFRSGEKTYQLLMQVAGRTSRGDERGEVIIQTYNPAHPAILSVARHDCRDYYEMELSDRKELDYPPFLHVIRILFSGPDKMETTQRALRFKTSLAKALKPGMAIELLGPSDAPLSFLNNSHRVQFLVKCARVPETVKLLEQAREDCPRSSVKMSVDVDAVSFL